MTEENNTANKSEQKYKKRKRIECIGIEFKDGLAENWAFDVPECFRESLDILYLPYVDKEESKKRGKKVVRMVWTRGVPPARSFNSGEVFYEPPGVRRMMWGDALKNLKRAVQIKDAKADQETGEEGWVCFTVSYYAEQKIDKAEEHTVSQAQFESFLRTGTL